MHSAETAKIQVLREIAGSVSVEKLPKSKYLVGTMTVHVRFRSNPKKGAVYSFNINPNTLSAEYELWICGSSYCYYLVPIALMRELYQHPQAYQDYHHPEIRVLEIDTGTHNCVYGRNKLSRDFGPNFAAKL